MRCEVNAKTKKCETNERRARRFLWLNLNTVKDCLFGRDTKSKQCKKLSEIAHLRMKLLCFFVHD